MLETFIRQNFCSQLWRRKEHYNRETLKILIIRCRSRTLGLNSDSFGNILKRTFLFFNKIRKKKKREKRKESRKEKKKEGKKSRKKKTQQKIIF